MNETAYNKYCKAWSNGYTNVDYLYRCFTVHDGEECQIFDGIDKDQEINDCLAGLELPTGIKDHLAPVLYNWFDAYFDNNQDDSSKYWSPILNLIRPFITNSRLERRNYSAWHDIMFASAEKLSFAEYVEQYQPSN